MSDPLEARTSLAATEPNPPELARVNSYEMDQNIDEDAGRPDVSPKPEDEYEVVSIGKKGMAKHTMGLLLLGCVVFMWTGSNFLGSVSANIRNVGTVTKHRVEHLRRQYICQTILPHLSQHLDLHARHGPFSGPLCVESSQAQRMEGSACLDARPLPPRWLEACPGRRRRRRERRLRG